MEISGLELHCLISEINERLSRGYYVGNISSISRDSFSLKMHHSTLPGTILILSTKGVWITKMGFRTFEESPIITSMKSEIERAKFECIEQAGDERIAYIRFRQLDGRLRFIVAEFFRRGNIIICDENHKIIKILNPVEVRHRTLRTGSIYQPPPTRGKSIFDLPISTFLELSEKESDRDMEIEKWLGRNFSLSKKYIDEVVTRAKMNRMKLGSAKREDLTRLFEHTQKLVFDVSTPKMHDPFAVLDDNERPIDAIPFRLESISKDAKLIGYGSMMEAVDDVFSGTLIEEGTSTRTVELDKRISILEHDFDQQNRAEAEVLSKANAIRKLAHELMSFSNTVTDIKDSSFTEILGSSSSKIIIIDGKKYLEIMNESVPFDSRLPRTSSLLFERAKELERGCQSIRNAKSRLLEQMQDLRKKTVTLQERVAVKPQVEKEWFERYRWFMGSEGLLCIGGRDASSNSAIIRKHLSERDLVFHAEVHGSPFFVLKDVSGDDADTYKTSLFEAAQATVSFSRGWKDGLSVADAYWVSPEQVKRGAPTGQFLPKGAFVIQGKRNYVKGVEIKLAIGITTLEKKYSLMCGPQEAVKKKSIAYCVILPGGMNPTNMAKKFKQEMVGLCTNISPAFKELLAYIKELSVDEIVKTLPHGQSKILLARKGDLATYTVEQVDSNQYGNSGTVS
jgi:predicted ribosome quality control (RQC) complex YloA/Tae2 family protein